MDQLEWHRPAVGVAPVQLPDLPAVPFLPVRYQVAQKLHACTEDPTPDYSNNRLRDIYDILLIRDLSVEPHDYPAIREACEEIFGSRGKQPWPPTVVRRDGWGVLWQNLQATEGSALPLDKALVEINAFIAAVAA